MFERIRHWWTRFTLSVDAFRDWATASSLGSRLIEALRTAVRYIVHAIGWSLSHAARFGLFLFFLVVVAGAASAAVTPIAFVCSAHDWIGCNYLSYGFGWVENTFAWYSFALLCPIAALRKCAPDTISALHMHAAFEALFAFSVVVGWIADVHKRCRKALRRVVAIVNKLPDITTRIYFRDATTYQTRIASRIRRWLPWYRTMTRMTVCFAMAAFVLTAIVAGNMLIVAAAADGEANKTLQFHGAAAVALAFAPFAAILFLYLDLIFLRALLGRALAPAYFYYRWVTLRQERKSIAQVLEYGRNDSSEEDDTPQ